jgi:putative transposase
VCSLMRRCMLEWCKPECVKMDNGSDYKSERSRLVLTGLHIEADFSKPFAPWEKPHIERAFRTFSHSLLELLPGYIGHNVEEAQAIRARQSFADRLFKKNEVIEVKLMPDELQTFCDRWCDDYYLHEEHSGLGGATPFQIRAQLRDVVSRIDDVRALDLLLGGGTVCKVGKKGIRFDKMNFIAPELHAVVGEDVLVRPDDSDVGRIVVYHDEKFLCLAECPEVTGGVSRRDIAILANSKKNAAVQEKKRELKALGKKANTRDLAWEILDAKRAKNAALAILPAPSVVHMTPALEAAGEAAAALAAADQPAWMRPATAEDIASVSRLMRTEQAQEETEEQRFCRAIRVLALTEAERCDTDRFWLDRYRTTDDFKGRWMVFEDFGGESFGLGDAFDHLKNLNRFHEGQT